MTGQPQKRGFQKQQKEQTMEMQSEIPLKKKKSEKRDIQEVVSPTQQDPNSSSVNSAPTSVVQSLRDAESEDAEQTQNDSAVEVFVSPSIIPVQSQSGESDIVCVSAGTMHQGHMPNGGGLQCVVMSACGFAFSYVKRPTLISTSDIDIVLECANNIYVTDVIQGATPRLLEPEEVPSHLKISNYNIVISMPEFAMQGLYAQRESDRNRAIIELEGMLNELFITHNTPDVGFQFTGQHATVSFWNDHSEECFFLFNSHAVGPNGKHDDDDDNENRARIFKVCSTRNLAKLLLINTAFRPDEQFSIHYLKVVSFNIDENVTNNNISGDESDAGNTSDGFTLTRKRGRPKKKKRGRPKIKENAHLDAVVKYNKSHPNVHREASKRYNKNNPTVNNETSKRYDKNNPTAHNEASKRYNKNNPTAHNEASKRYNKNNPTAHNEASKRYNKNNPTAHNEASKRYNKNNPIVNREAVHRYSQSNQELNRECSQRYRESHAAEVHQANREYSTVRGIAPPLRRNGLIGERSGDELNQVPLFSLKNSSLNSANTYVCSHCSAKLFEEEKSRTQWCCGQGKYNILQLPPLNAGFYSDSYFLKYARPYNNLFAFTALNVSHGFQHPTGLSFIKIQGKTYHQIHDLSYTGFRNPIGMYIDDGEERRRQAQNLNLRHDVLADIANYITRVNPFIDCFKRLNDEPAEEAHLVFETTSRRTHGNILGDMPRGCEVAAIINTELETYQPRSIVVWKIGEGRPHTIDILNPLYETLQYPLLYPHGGSGWGLNAVDNNGRKLAQVKYYRCLLLANQRFSQLGRLSEEWTVDMFSRTEDERLRYISNMQRRNTDTALRSAPLEEVARQVAEDETVQGEGGVAAGRIYLPNTFTGGARYMQTKYMDGICTVNRLGKPTYFLTMTCNPKWPEIQQSMPSSNAVANPLLCARVFELKMTELLRDLRSGAFFGECIYIMSVVEFQKRGLPHVHICFKVKDGPVQNIEIDKVIRADIPSIEEAGGRLRQAVLKHNIHGPCGEGHRTNLPCWDSEKKKCLKYFPKECNAVTYVDGKGFVHYKRDKNNTAVITYQNRQVPVSDEWVVPYNAALTLKYDCHINVELSSTRKIIKYMYKYITKGPDEARVAVVPEHLRNDEVEQYVTKRYVGSCDAIWRMLEFDLVTRKPTVNQITVHLEGQHNVYFRAGHESDAVDNSSSDLLIYFNRPTEPEFDNLTYQDFYENYLVHKSRPKTKNVPIYSTTDGKYFVAKRQRNEMIARLFWVPPSRGEQFYLRMLLQQFPCRGYADLLARGGSDCITYQEVARNLGIANDEDEYGRTIEEAATFLTGYRLRRFFVLVITNGGPGLILWDKFKDVICEDLLERNPDHRELMYKEALIQIDRLLRKHGSRLADHGLPSVRDDTTELIREREEYTNRAEDLNEYVEHWLELLSPGQKAVFDHIQRLQHDQNSAGNENAIFLDGPSGTGKTLLLNVIVAYVRGVLQKVALCTASSGIAAQNYPGGCTAHSMFRLPLDILDDQHYWSITNGSQRAELIRNAALIVYDEAPMSHKYLIGILDRSLRDLMQSSRPFGGKVIIFAGDFRQIPPVVPRARSNNDIVQASLKTSPLWPIMKKFSLTVAQRTRGDAEYSDFLLRLGSGECESIGNTGQSLIQLRGVSYVTELQELIDFVFPEDILQDPDVCTTRAILSTHNVNVNEINKSILERVSGEYVTCLSVDEVDRELSDEFYLGPDTLHRVQATGVPDHELKLKIGCVCMIMRNLSFVDSLVNGTKVIVVDVSPRIVTVCKPRDSTRYLIPRISFKTPIEPNSPIEMHRRQFPLQVCYAMTVHKSQGQTIERVGVDLRSDCFSHGQLYVALGRVRDNNNIKLLIQRERIGIEGALVTNVVIQELIDDNNLIV